MRCLFQKLIAVCVVLGLLSGCATTDANRTKMEGTGYGALAGAALGAGTGALLGGKNGALIGAAIGTAVGAGGGYMLGSTVADRKQKYANDEDRLNGEIDAVAQYNSDLKNFNKQASTRIKDLKQEVSKLKVSYKKGKVQVSDLKKKQDEINLLISESDQIKSKYNKELIALNKYQKSISQTQDQSKVAKLGHEVRLLKNSIAMLDSNNKQMAQITKSLTVRK